MRNRNSINSGCQQIIVDIHNSKYRCRHRQLELSISKISIVAIGIVDINNVGLRTLWISTIGIVDFYYVRTLSISIIIDNSNYRY